MLDLFKQLYEAFGGGPLAAIASLLVLAVVSGWLLFIREGRAHLRTTREVVALTTAIQATWQQQLEEGKRARELQERTLQVQETSLAVLRSITSGQRSTAEA